MPMIFARKTKGKAGVVSVDPAKIDAILTRGVEDIFVLDSLKKKLESGKKLRVKLGIDPTSPNLHLGRAIPLRKLRALQDLGHTPVFIVGDFTAQIGDPSDKLEKRPMLTEEAIKKNVKTYKDQVGKILDLSNAEFHFNSKWLSKLGFQEIAQLAETFSVQQMTSRRNFKDRIDAGEEVSMREFLYPLMQGYDSVAVKSDVELGGFDQLFNLKAGRIIQKHYGQPEQDVLTCSMLEGTDGRKMSSSWGNVITLTDKPSDMYGKVMAVHDELLVKYFTLCTDMSTDEINNIQAELTSGTNPKDIKMRLARELVTMYHSAGAAQKAEQDFIETFAKGGVPEDIQEVAAPASAMLADVFVTAGVTGSKTEFARLVKEGAVLNMDSNKKVTDIKVLATAGTYKIGKRRFIKIVIK
jgi:tyrosyl-tRNA synthetase